MDNQKIQTRLAYLRREIEAERISQAEVLELQGLKEYIDPSDTILLEWAGVDEFEEEKNNRCFKCGQLFNNSDIDLLPDNTTICHNCKSYLIEQFNKYL